MIYPYNVMLTREEEDTCWVAKSLCLKGCIGVGDSPEAAVKELAENEEAWLETARELQMEIPAVPVVEESHYSGKVSLRMSPTTHAAAAIAAKREGISLNQLINEAIISYTCSVAP